MIIDISPTIAPGIQNWPGDTPFSHRKVATFDDGDGIDIGTIESSVHVGAHTDAPMHYARGGPSVADVPLWPYYGPCQVVDVAARRGKRFDFVDFQQAIDSPRVLCRTGTFPDPTHWNTDFAAPSASCIHELGDRGVVLVGFDTPSTDLFESKGLEAHHALLTHGMMNLEGLVLAHVPPGHYTLAAFPLKLAGMDGSPVRAVLIRE